MNNPIVKRIALLIALFIGVGVVNNVNAISNSARPPESWLVDMVPSQVGDWRLIPLVQGSKISYKMDDMTYEELNPIGISCQRFTNGVRDFDVVVIAGDTMQSFHDQRWCFVAQGWTIDKEDFVDIPTKSRGNLPGFLVQISRPGKPPAWALFTFQGPGKFHSTTPEASKDYFWNEILRGKRHIGFSYRFIPQYTDSLPEEVISFASKFLDEAYKTSDGKL